jgi:ABC-type bacteriocin/lantibiotic exporter with double-glycine peptidase domain
MKKIILEYLLSNNKKSFLFLIFLIFINLFLEIFSLGLFIPLIKVLLNKDNYNYYLDYYLNYNFFSNFDHKSFLLFLLILLFIIFLLKNIILIISNFVQFNFFRKYIINITTKLYDNYLNKEYLYFTEENTSVILRNLRSETNSTLTFFQSALTLITEIIILFFILSFLLFRNLESTLVVIIITIPAMLIYHLLTEKFLRRLGEKRIYLDGNINKGFLDSLGSIKELKIYQKEKMFKNYLSKNLNEFYDVGLNFQMMNIFPRLFLEILIVTALLTIIYLIEFNLIKSSSDDVILLLGLFAAAASRILPGLSKILTNFHSLKFRISSVELLSKEIGRMNENIIAEKEDLSNNLLIIQDTKFQINFNNVSFSYPDSEKIILNNLSYNFMSSKIYGISGDSGSGKTTLVDLITGLLKPSSGKILLNNNFDINKNLQVWRKNFSYVPQNIFLFDNSIESNISFEIEEKNINPDNIKKAIKDSEIQDFIESLPNKSKTNIGQFGSKLSGGQGQRIGIARSVYQNSKILIFDESTNALDEQIEKKILKTIKNLKKDKIIFIISHNKNTLSICDEILNILS